MKLMKYIFLALCIVPLLNAQRMPERMVIYNPFFNPDTGITDNKISWINGIGGWGEFGNYLSDAGKTNEWYQKLGLFLEFFRTSGKSLSVISNIEFIADPHNDINFNPRAIFWEEAFLYTQRAGDNFWQAGYYHRCKHDIDNLDYGTERSLIYGSISGRYIYSLVNDTGLKSFASLRADIYTILQDYRKPASVAEPNAEDLVSSLALNFVLRNSFTALIALSASAFLQLNAYSRRTGFFRKFADIHYMRPSAGIETGISFTGNARFSIILRYEYFNDTGLDIYPASANLLSVGVGLYPEEIW